MAVYGESLERFLPFYKSSCLEASSSHNKSEQSYSGHNFQVKLLLKVVVFLLENHKAAGLLFLRLTMNSG
jgi:hypothetical protein